MKKYLVVSICRDETNIEEFPDIITYPHLCKYVEGDEDVFIVDLETNNFWLSNEFFYMNDVRMFEVLK